MDMHRWTYIYIYIYKYIYIYVYIYVYTHTYILHSLLYWGLGESAGGSLRVPRGGRPQRRLGEREWWPLLGRSGGKVLSQRGLWRWRLGRDRKWGGEMSHNTNETSNHNKKTHHICICIHTYIRVYIYVHIYINIMDMHRWTYIYIYIYIYLSIILI